MFDCTTICRSASMAGGRRRECGGGAAIPQALAAWNKGKRPLVDGFQDQARLASASIGIVSNSTDKAVAAMHRANVSPGKRGIPGRS